MPTNSPISPLYEFPINLMGHAVRPDGSFDSWTIGEMMTPPVRTIYRALSKAEALAAVDAAYAGGCAYCVVISRP